MIFLILLLNVGLIFIYASADHRSNNTIPFISIDEPTYYRLPDDLLPEDIINVTNKYRLSNYIIPTYYDIWINLSYTEHVSIDGEIGIDLMILHPTRTIDFHVQRPYVKIRDYALFLHSDNTDNDTSDNTTCIFRPIIDTTINNTSCVLTRNLRKKSYSDASHILVLHFDTKLPRGNYTLKMRFKTTFNNEENFYRLISHLETFNSTTKQDTRWSLFIAFSQAIGARHIFPCWDEPNFKAIFRLALIHDFHYFSFSNTSVRPMQYAINKKNKIWSIFKNTPKIPTYSLIHPIYFNKSITSDVKVMLNRKEYIYISFESKYTEFATVIADNISHWISKWNNVKDDKFFDIIVLNNWPKNAIMPKRGYVIYRKADITYREEIDHIVHKIEIASLVAREIIQLWLSYKVNPFWWSSLWLNDGIAVLLEMEALNKILPNSRIMDLYAVQIRYESLHLDELMKPLTWNVKTASEINSVVSYFRYIKAPAILRMLQHTISDDVFRKGLKIYFNTDENRSATLDDFWTAMQTAYDESPNQKHKNFSIARMMNVWTKEAHYPVLRLNQHEPDRNIDKNGLSLVTILLDDPYMLPENHWWIPLTITTARQNPKWTSLEKFLIIKPTVLPFYKIPLENIEVDEWILVDVQQAGYYRINYNIANWKRLVSYLKSKMYTKIHVLNRAKLIDDSFHLAIAGRLSYHIFWKISSYLHQEKDYIAWYPMFKAIEHMSSIFPLSNEAAKEIKGTINDILGGLLAHIGYQEDPNDNDLTKRLRQEAVKWACTLGFPNCIKAAQHQMMQYFGPRTIFPWWKKLIFCYGINANNNETLFKAIYLFKYFYFIDDRKETLNLLESLACIKNEEVIKSILRNEEITNTTAHHELFSNLRVIDRINIFLLIVAKHAKNNEVVNYILSNFEKVKPREISTLVTLINLINHSYSKVQLDKIYEFVANNRVKELIMDIEYKLNIRWLQIKRQEYYSALYL